MAPEVYIRKSAVSLNDSINAPLLIDAQAGAHTHSVSSELQTNTQCFDRHKFPSWRYVRPILRLRPEINTFFFLSFTPLDFNFGPSNAAYSLLVGDPLTEQQIVDIENSRVVHITIDPSVPIADRNLAIQEEEGGEAESEQDPDRVIKNARVARPEDGLLGAVDLARLFAQPEAIGPLHSAYGYWRDMDEMKTFGSRCEIPSGRQGRYEPIYTSFTHFWKVTLGTYYALDIADCTNAYLIHYFSPFIFR